MECGFKPLEQKSFTTDIAIKIHYYLSLDNAVSADIKKPCVPRL